MAGQLGRLKTVRQVAESVGKPIHVTRRWLWALDRKYGNIIKRIGGGKLGPIAVSMAALRAVDPSFFEVQRISRDEVAELQKIVVDLKKENLQLKNRLRDVFEVISFLMSKFRDFTGRNAPNSHP